MGKNTNSVGGWHEHQTHGIPLVQVLRISIQRGPTQLDLPPNPSKGTFCERQDVERENCQGVDNHGCDHLGKQDQRRPLVWLTNSKLIEPIQPWGSNHDEEHKNIKNWWKNAGAVIGNVPEMTSAGTTISIPVGIHHTINHRVSCIHILSYNHITHMYIYI